MKIKELTMNLAGKKVVFTITRPYEGDGFSVLYGDEVICDGYRSGKWFYFLSMSEKVKLFEDIFTAEVRKKLNLLFK